MEVNYVHTSKAPLFWGGERSHRVKCGNFNDKFVFSQQPALFTSLPDPHRAPNPHPSLDTNSPYLQHNPQRTPPMLCPLNPSPSQRSSGAPASHLPTTLPTAHTPLPPHPRHPASSPPDLHSLGISPHLHPHPTPPTHPISHPLARMTFLLRCFCMPPRLPRRPPPIHQHTPAHRLPLTSWSPPQHAFSAPCFPPTPCIRLTLLTSTLLLPLPPRTHTLTIHPPVGFLRRGVGRRR